MPREIFVDHVFGIVWTQKAGLVSNRQSISGMLWAHECIYVMSCYVYHTVYTYIYVNITDIRNYTCVYVNIYIALYVYFMYV